MKFLIQKNEIPPTFSLIYREEEYSFNTESHSDDGITSIMVNDLQLEIDDAGKIIYVWGVCPLIKYEETNETPKNFEPNCLVALLDNKRGRACIRHKCVCILKGLLIWSLFF